MRPFIALILLLTCSFGSYAQCNPCGGQLTQNPYIEGTHVGMQRYLARGIQMEGMVNQNIPNTQYASWWDYVTKTNVSCSGNSIAVQCFVGCSDPYCPAGYCQDVEMLAELNASFIFRATGSYGSEHNFWSGSDFLNASQQLVDDINLRYDCAGLARPIIQATIFEVVTGAVNDVAIPAGIIQAFVNEMGEQDMEDYFYGGQPVNRNFSLSRVGYPKYDKNGNITGWCPNLQSIEGRMWLFYQATIYIDMGYTSLNLGQLNLISQLEGVLPSFETQYRNVTKKFLNDVRQYAINQGKFVVLTCEGIASELFVDKNTNTMLLDFYSVIMRPRDVVTPMPNDQNLCTSYTVDPNMFSNTPCATEPLKATVDPCHGAINKLMNVSAYSHDGSIFYDNVPFTVYPDHGQEHGAKGPYNFPYPGMDLVWGYDDTRWFWQMSTPCKEHWVYSEMCRISRNMSFAGGRGYIQAPGRLLAKRYNNKHLDTPEWRNLYFRLADYPGVKQAVKDVWNVKSPGISMQEECLHGIRNTVFRVLNPDCASIYVWHLKRPDGTWETPIFGETFIPGYQGQGISTVYLRQDNLGLTNTIGTNHYGSETYSLNVQIPISGLSCTSLKEEGSVTEGTNLPSIVEPANDIEYFNYVNGLAMDEKIPKNLHINESTTSVDIAIYPNPINENIFIKGDFKHTAYVSVINQLGQVVLSETLNANAGETSVIDTKNIALGNYVIKVQTADNVYYRKIVKQ